MRFFLVLIAALIALVPASAAPPPDWTRTVTMAPDGAYVLGNPAAPTRLVEYVSYTCPHCAHFVAEASTPLRDGWVRRGLVSVELRHAIRDPYDLTAALLARCGGKARFFADHEALFANHEAWMPQVEAYETRRGERKFTDAAAQMVDIATATGLGDVMAKRGLAPALQRKCLADKKAMAIIAMMAKNAWEDRKIDGTPAFAINGALVPGVHNWAGLIPAWPAPPK